MPIVFIAALAGLAAIAIYFGVLGLVRSGPVGNRLERFVASPTTPMGVGGTQAVDKRSSASSPVLKNIGDVVVNVVGPNSAQSMAKRLRAAGNPYGWQVNQFFAVMVVGAIGGGFIGFLLGHSLLFAVIGLAVGGYLPNMWLSGEIGKRKKAIVRALPNALDLMNIGVEAGLGLNRAMLEVAERWDNDLTREFRVLLGEMKLGRARREALEDMANRLNIPEVSVFIRAVIQAEELGTGIARTLQSQSDLMNMRRRQKAEEQAQKAGVKMLIPMVMFIFPAIFVVILAPAIPKFMHMFTAFGPAK